MSYMEKSDVYYDRFYKASMRIGLSGLAILSIPIVRLALEVVAIASAFSFIYNMGMLIISGSMEIISSTMKYMTRNNESGTQVIDSEEINSTNDFNQEDKKDCIPNVVQEPEIATMQSQDKSFLSNLINW